MAFAASAAAEPEHPNLLLPAELLDPSPSKKHGIAPDTEVQYRIFSCDLLQEMGILLEVPQVVMATGQTLLHRFFYRKSFSQFDAHISAMAALFLAAKVEEVPRRMRDILNVCYHLKLKRERKPEKPIILGGNLYTRWKIELIKTERFILKELGFSMYNIMEHPHKFILYYVAALQGSRALANRAWSFLNDSLRLDLCVRYHAEAIACAAINLAARNLGEPLPHSVPWYEVFNTSRTEMEEVCELILALYEQPPVAWLPPLRPDALPADDQDEGEGAPLPLPPVAAVTQGLALAGAAGASLLAGASGARTLPGQLGGADDRFVPASGASSSSAPSAHGTAIAVGVSDQLSAARALAAARAAAVAVAGRSSSLVHVSGAGASASTVARVGQPSVHELSAAGASMYVSADAGAAGAGAGADPSSSLRVAGTSGTEVPTSVGAGHQRGRGPHASRSRSRSASSQRGGYRGRSRASGDGSRRGHEDRRRRHPSRSHSRSASPLRPAERRRSRDERGDDRSHQRPDASRSRSQERRREGGRHERERRESDSYHHHHNRRHEDRGARGRDAHESSRHHRSSHGSRGSVHSGRELPRDHVSSHRRTVESVHAGLSGTRGGHDSSDLCDPARASDGESQRRDQRDVNNRELSDSGLLDVVPRREAPTGAGTNDEVAELPQRRDSSMSRWGE